MKEILITDTTDIKGVIKEYYEQLYGYQFDNWDEMDRFLKRYKLSKLIQGERLELFHMIP